MVCTATSTKLRRAQKSAAATLVEYIISIGVGSIALLAIVAFSIYTGRSFAGMMNYVELESQSRSTLDGMIKDIRQTAILTGFTSNSLTFRDYDDKPLLYEYSPENRTLTRTKDGTSKTLLKECDSLNFGIFQRNTTNGTYDQYPASLQASNCKVVQVTWVCSRAITGTKLNTETVQTAKIVIRNQ